MGLEGFELLGLRGDDVVEAAQAVGLWASRVERCVAASSKMGSLMLI